jgi:alkylation response protein AidB-like acyl-CoA dehydrogenase
MHFTFTEEQALLQDSVQKFVENDYTFEQRRESAASELGFSAQRWSTFAELGWLGLGIPESLGGYGGGAVESAVVLEGLGGALAVEPYTSAAVMTATILVDAGSDAQKALLAQVVEGKLRVAFALAERHSGFDLGRVTTTATQSADGYILSGDKSVAFHADSADKLIVTARTSGHSSDANGITLFLVDANCEGISRRGYATVDGQRAAEVALRDVAVSAADVVGSVDNGLDIIEKAVDAGTVALCAEASGIMKHMYEATLEYMRGREQFGQNLASFQALQHRVVDMFVEYELSRSMTYMAAVKLDAPRTERRRAVSSAKVQIGKSGQLVGQEAIQLHGGMGMTDDMAISHYFKRLTMINSTFGDVDHHMDYLVEHIEPA